MFKKIKKWIIIVLLIIIMITTYYIYNGYRLYKKTLQQYDIDEVISIIQSNPHYLTIDEIPKIYQNAVIAAEDPSFYSHRGINPLAIINAFFKNVESMSYVEGGSTITQQIAKNLFFTQEKKMDRKIAEVFMVRELEKRYSKVELLEIYVNAIYYGDGYYGLYEASMGYFNKEANDLTAYEATLLAGIPNAPSVYALTNNFNLAKQRQQTVLDKMVKEGFLTIEEKNAILDER